MAEPAFAADIHLECLSGHPHQYRFCPDHFDLYFRERLHKSYGYHVHQFNHFDADGNDTNSRLEVWAGRIHLCHCLYRDFSRLRRSHLPSVHSLD